MKKLLPFVAVFLFLQCHSPQKISNSHYSIVRINKDSLKLSDEKIHKIIAPYKKSLDSIMSEVICINEQDLKKELPEGTLCNFVCDELMNYYSRIFSNNKVDFCMYNYGGLRVSTINAGEITVGKIYELCPFENTLEAVEIDGKSCKILFDMLAQNGGLPVSSNLRMKITNNEASEIYINGEAFDTNKNYTVLTNDYFANGGDKMDLLKNSAHHYPLGIKVRDALIFQLKEKGENNIRINVVKDGRISK